MSLSALTKGAIVHLQDVTVNFGGVNILDHVSASVPKGSYTAIVGPNGAGKTTLLLAILQKVPYTGRILVTCEPPGRPARIGYVPQRFQFDRGTPLTVMEFMVMGRQRLPLWFGHQRFYREKARDILRAVKAEALESRRLGALSGGEMQRVLLALALQQEPDLLVLDEPSTGLDLQGEHIYCELLDGLRTQHGFTQLTVSHDLATVTHHATHVICLNRRVAAEGAPRSVLTSEALTAIFGLHMGLVDSRAMPDGKSNCTAPCCARDEHA